VILERSKNATPFMIQSRCCSNGGSRFAALCNPSESSDRGDIQPTKRFRNLVKRMTSRRVTCVQETLAKGA